MYCLYTSSYVRLCAGQMFTHKHSHLLAKESRRLQFSSLNPATACGSKCIWSDNDSSMIRYEKSVLRKDTKITQARKSVIGYNRRAVNNEHRTKFSVPDFKWHFKSARRSVMLCREFVTIQISPHCGQCGNIPVRFRRKQHQWTSGSCPSDRQIDTTNGPWIRKGYQWLRPQPIHTIKVPKL